MDNNWYCIADVDAVDSPALCIYPERIQSNIEEMIRVAGNPQRLMPHVKTVKMHKVIEMELKAGIQRFKCATIAEAEMLAQAGAKNILLAYQLNKTKALRFLQLIHQYPDVRFSSLVDNAESARLLDSLFADEVKKARVYIDVDNGMHRTGFPSTGDLKGFYSTLQKLPQIDCLGFHVYDGHLREPSFQERKHKAEQALQPVISAMSEIKGSNATAIIEIIAGGTPSFTVHALNTEVYCSPGTCLLWDWGYAEKLTEQKFLHAAVLLTRIISKPQKGYITTDLGHKSVAAENPIDKRIRFLNLEQYNILSQSEEHLSVKVDDSAWEQLKIGDALYGIPYHICPTVALYDDAVVIKDNLIVQRWPIEARKRKINV